MTTSIKNKIKSIRELKNYTQQYLAGQLGIIQAGYSKIEKGKTSMSYATLLEIARILDVSAEDIISFEYERYFKSLNPVKDDNSETSNNCKDQKKLYEEKIKLLEKLLNKTEDELEYYKNRFCQF